MRFAGAVGLLIASVSVAHAQAQPPTFEQLANGSYDFGPEDKRTLTLKGGVWHDAAEDSHFEIIKAHAIGDLDGDKARDAAVILMESSSGTGRFYYLFVFVSTGGTLVQLEPPQWLGDRSIIERVTIDRRGALGVRFVTHSPDDPSCCPTMRVENRYRVVKGRLVPLDDQQ
jgi:hypothetical protein